MKAVAYEKAANGDPARALRFAVDDSLVLDDQLAKVLLAVSQGYVRDVLPDSVS